MIELIRRERYGPNSTKPTTAFATTICCSGDNLAHVLNTLYMQSGFRTFQVVMKTPNQCDEFRFYFVEFDEYFGHTAEAALGALRLPLEVPPKIS